MIQKIRITQGEEQFWAIVAPRVRKEGEARLRKMLDEFFPPATQEVVEATSEGNEPLTVELPKPIVEIVDEPEPDTTPDEVVSEEYSHTQEVFKQPEEKPIAAPESVVVSYEESEDVERTENSLFVEEAPDPLIVSELTASRIKLAKDDVNRHFYMHFVASLGGVFLALMIAKLMIALF